MAGRFGFHIIGDVKSRYGSVTRDRFESGHCGFVVRRGWSVGIFVARCPLPVQKCGRLPHVRHRAAQYASPTHGASIRMRR